VAGATILPFPAVGGVNTPPRPLPPTVGGDGFAGAMDDALGAPSSVRRDDARRADAAAPRPRRSETARPRDLSNSDAAATTRRASTPPRKPASADRSDELPNDETAARASEQDDAVAADAPAPPSEDRPAPTAADNGAGPAGEDDAVAAEAVAAQAASAGAEALTDLAAAAAEAEGAGAGAGTTGAPEMKMAVEPGDEAGEELGGATPDRKRTADTGLPNQAQASATARARADVMASPDEQMGELVKAAVHAAHESAAAPAAQAPQLASTAAEQATPSTAQAAANQAAAAFSETASAGEAVASVEAQTGGDVSDSGAHDQTQQRPAAPTPSSQAHEVVAAAGAAPDGVRFSMNVAAGSAAYASAAPRGEEAVLPQIVQHIRMHVTQGSSEARMQLKPEHLGALNITLKVEQGQVTATIQADVAAVRQFIESHESSLRQALSEQGLQLAKLVVNPDGQQAEQDGREPGEQRRQQQRRRWRDEDVTFEVLV
jgi:flagellar hook-length control protein FliK